MFLLESCDSSHPAFHMMYSAYELNKQGDNSIPFPIWNQSAVPCPVLTVASRPEYRFLKRQYANHHVKSLFELPYTFPAYLRLLIFLLAILIPACASSSPAFLMMYSAYKLNKQGDNIQPWRTSFPIWNRSVVLCPVLTVASWPAYRFLKRQVRWSGIPISFRIFHSLLWSTQSKALA